jgi:hypothetical protein
MDSSILDGLSHLVMGTKSEGTRHPLIPLPNPGLQFGLDGDDFEALGRPTSRLDASREVLTDDFCAG